MPGGCWEANSEADSEGCLEADWAALPEVACLAADWEASWEADLEACLAADWERVGRLI